ncbi:metal binding domain of Ada-domain-containing protein [Xylariaceae sp. AK1471]|nr:metal binding domain of Ada-domain-containing protein [Xylariaceae sp. AK1471]
MQEQNHLYSSALPVLNHDTPKEQLSCYPMIMESPTSEIPDLVNASSCASTSRIYNTPAQRWRALQSRAPDANADFFYGVVTTRIYCRPTCPGRVARRANVVFFDTTLIARASGYRSCKRCQPNSQQWNRESRSLDIVRRGQTIITHATRGGHAWKVEGVAEQLDIRAAHFHRVFKKHVGLTPRGYAQTLSRIDHHHDADRSLATEQRSSHISTTGALEEDNDLLTSYNTRNLELIQVVGECPTVWAFEPFQLLAEPSPSSMGLVDLPGWEDWLVFEG